MAGSVMTTAADRRPIVLAAGGTGGHIFPAEALARELIARGRTVVLVTDRRGKAFGDRLPDVATHRIRAGRFDTGGVLGKVAGVADLVLGTFQARRLLKSLAPAAVVGFGGYPSVPTVLAAARLRLPTAIHEQNAVLGRANRLLAPRAGRIATGFATVAMVRDADRARLVHTGNPVRPAVAALRDREPYAPPAAEHGPFEILVLGGSQGARIFSEVVPAALAGLPGELRVRLNVSQQARPEDLERVRSAYAESGIVADLASFFDDVPARLARAHLVIARSGASTLTELVVAGRPAILVPYPHAADDHQSANARVLGEAGAAWVVPQPTLSPESLMQHLTALASAPDALARAAAAARGLGQPDAAGRLADLVLSLAGDGNGANGGNAAAASSSTPVREQAA